MVQLYSWLHFTFKDLSNDTSHAQIRVQTKKLCHQQVGEENKSLSRLYRDKASDKAFLRQNPDFVAIEPMTRLSCDKTKFCHNRVSNKLCHDKPSFVAIEPVTRLSYDKTRFCCDRVSNKLCRDKPRFCRDKA